MTVPLYSKLADMIGRRPIILIGLAVFLVGSVLCGLAWDMPSLIVFRAVQGIGAGAILPITITIVGDIYTVAERARVQGTSRVSGRSPRSRAPLSEGSLRRRAPGGGSSSSTFRCAFWRDGS